MYCVSSWAVCHVDCHYCSGNGWWFFINRNPAFIPGMFCKLMYDIILSYDYNCVKWSVSSVNRGAFERLTWCFCSLSSQWRQQEKTTVLDTKTPDDHYKRADIAAMSGWDYRLQTWSQLNSHWQIIASPGRRFSEKSASFLKNLFFRFFRNL